MTKGNGVTASETKAFQEKFVKSVKSMGDLFDFIDIAKINKLSTAMGGCENSDCYRRIAKELGVNLVVSVRLNKNRDDYIASYSVFDTEFGDEVFNHSEKLPGTVSKVSSSWIRGFSSQLEPLGYAVHSSDGSDAEEAAKATIILDDQLTGKLSRDKSPYLLVKSIVIPAGQVLEIEEGVRILIGGKNTSIVCYGQLFVNGTVANPVVFRSSKKEPNSWDWDRIYVRGNTRSHFRHCVIMHSNFGLCVENGNLMLAGCSFEKNSITAMYFRQADVQIERSIIGKGHIMGIHVDGGSRVSIDSGSIKGCSRAIIVQAYGRISVKGTRLENNDYAVALDSRSFVDLLDVLVYDNRVGILSDVDIPKNRLLTVRGNDENFRLGTRKELMGLFARPEMLTAVKVREKALLVDTATFEKGFSSTITRGESFAARWGIIGQLNGGLAYRSVTDLNREVHTGSSIDETPHQSTYVPGIRPEVQLYMQSKVGDRELDLTFNAYGNYNSPRLQPLSGEPSGDPNLRTLEAYRNLQKIELINISASLPGRSLFLGDFSENISDLSVSSRQIRGIKYLQNFDLTDERKATAFFSFGQSSLPWPKGLKPDMLDSNTTPARQEWLGCAAAKGEVIRDFKVGANFVFTRQIDNPLLFPGLSFDSTDLYGADPKISALSWSVTGHRYINRYFSAYVELAAGYGDTLSVDVDSSDITLAHSKDTLIHRPIDEKNIAGMIGLEYQWNGFTGLLEYIRAENQFYTGGNPSMKPSVGALQKARYNLARTIELERFKAHIPSVDLAIGLDWEGAVSEEVGIKVDTAGPKGYSIFGLSEAEKLNLIASKSNPDFSYHPFENRFRGSLSLRIPISVFSIEPELSYYHESKPLLKRDSISKQISVSVDGQEKKVVASEYVDAESRKQLGLGLLWAPGYGNEFISNMRLKINLEGILIEDFNDGDVDPLKWSKNDGSQKKIKGSLSTRIWKRKFNNKLESSWRSKTKKEREELMTTVSLMDKLSFDIIPRKIQIGINGYYTKDVTNYVDNSVSITDIKKVYGAELECKLSLLTSVSLTAKSGYEYGYDNASGGAENYKTYFGGVSANYLF